MIEVISIASSIITCLLFILYIIGHLLAIKNDKSIYFDDIDFIDIKTFFENHDFSDENVFNFTDKEIVTKDNFNKFEIIKIKSKHGFRKIKAFKIDLLGFYSEGNKYKNEKRYINKSKELLKEYKGIDKIIKDSIKLNKKDTLYFVIPTFEFVPHLYFEIQRNDFVKIEFCVSISGKNGKPIFCNDELKMTFMGYLFYLCK